MYDLNDNGFDAKQGVTIFNDGNAGLVNDLKMSVYKKTKEDKPNAPDYKIIFSDKNGGECSTSYWYVTQDTQYNTVDEQVRKQGKSMKHIIHAIYGADHQIGFKAENATQLLDQAMKYIKDGLANAGKFRIFATYGTLNATKKYIQPRSWVPFVESMSVDETSTRLKLAPTVDAITRIEESQPALQDANAEDLMDASTDDW
jgi:hypothetical protein